MKIQVVSDLHLEFGRLEENYEKICAADAEVLVLAGDISSHRDIVDDVLRLQEDSGKRIVFVPGNHEYYGTTRKRLDKELMLMQDINPKVHVLLERDIFIKGICFLGSTGWWDGSNGAIGVNQKMGLNDFRQIYDLCDEGNLDGVVWGRKAQTYLSSRMHWLRHHLPETKLCVVTHHYPHNRSLHPHFRGSQLNPCFGNRWEWMFEKYHPELWIHGHTHAPFNYVVSEDNLEKDYTDLKKSRVVCNPQGYPMEYAVPKEKIEKYFDDNGVELLHPDLEIYTTTENKSFDPQLVIEL